MIRRKLYLHVGLHKTGTTAIQNYLHGNLDHPDYAYFDVGRPNPSLVILQAFKQNFEEQAYFDGRQLGEAQIAALRTSARKTFDAALDRADKTNVVMSAEGISSLIPSECETFLRVLQTHFDELQVIMYVRPPKSRVESAFQEKLKTRAVSLDDPYVFNYRKTVGKFDRVVGPENVLVLPFKPELFPNGNVVSDFMGRLGLDVATDLLSRANRGLSLPAVQLLYLYRKHFPQGIPADRQLFELLQQLEGLPFHLHSDLFRKLYLDRDNSVAWLQQRAGFGVEEDLTAHDDHAVRREADLESVPASSIDWLRDMLRQYELQLPVITQQAHSLAKALRALALSRKAGELRRAGLATRGREILLHAGLPKTATTSIQATCARNKERLAEDGWNFPVFYLGDRPITNHTFPLVGLVDENNHIAIRWGVDPVWARGEYDRQVRALVDSDEQDRILLSAEGVSEWDLKRLPVLREYLQNLDCELRLVVVMRDPMEWTQSLVQQYVKMGRVLETLNFEGIAQNLKNRFVRLERVFGDELVVLDFERLKAHPGGVVAGFLYAIGLSESLLQEIEYVRVNESWSAEAIRMASYINRELPLYTGNKLTDGRSDKDLHCLAKLPGDKFGLAPDSYREAQEYLAPVGQWLADRYGITLRNGRAAELSAWSDETLCELRSVLEQLPSAQLLEKARDYLVAEAEGLEPERAALMREVIEQLAEFNPAGSEQKSPG